MLTIKNVNTHSSPTKLEIRRNAIGGDEDKDFTSANMMKEVLKFNQKQNECSH